MWGILPTCPVPDTNNNNMKTHRYTLALIAGAFLATAAAVAGAYTSVGVEGILGFATAFVVLALAATEYGFGGRRLCSK